MRVTAAVLYDVHKPYSVETVELDPPKRGEVLIKVGAAGVCRSDLHFQKGEAAIALPAVLGHEGSGTVERVGEGVTKVKPGDRVILGWIKGSGIEAGGTVFQSSRGPVNSGGVSTFSELSVVSENRCVLLPDGVPMDVAVLFG